MKSLSRVRLFATPWTVAYQAPQSMEFSRQEYWSGLPFPSPGHLPNPGIEPGSPPLQADALPSEPPGTLAKATPDNTEQPNVQPAPAQKEASTPTQLACRSPANLLQVPPTSTGVTSPTGRTNGRNRPPLAAKSPRAARPLAELHRLGAGAATLLAKLQGALARASATAHWRQERRVACGLHRLRR